MGNEGVPELMLIGSVWNQEPELHLPVLVWPLGDGGAGTRACPKQRSLCPRSPGCVRWNQLGPGGPPNWSPESVQSWGSGEKEEVLETRVVLVGSVQLSCPNYSKLVSPR